MRYGIGTKVCGLFIWTSRRFKPAKRKIRQRDRYQAPLNTYQIKCFMALIVVMGLWVWMAMAAMH